MVTLKSEALFATKIEESQYGPTQKMLTLLSRWLKRCNSSSSNSIGNEDCGKVIIMITEVDHYEEVHETETENNSQYHSAFERNWKDPSVQCWATFFSGFLPLYNRSIGSTYGKTHLWILQWYVKSLLIFPVLGKMTHVCGAQMVVGQIEWLATVNSVTVNIFWTGEPALESWHCVIW